MSGNLEMLRSGIQMVTRRETEQGAHYKPNTKRTRTHEHPGVVVIVTMYSKQHNQCTHEKSGSWAGSRDLRQCMNIVVLQATTHPSCQSHTELSNKWLRFKYKWELNIRKSYASW